MEKKKKRKLNKRNIILFLIIVLFAVFLFLYLWMVPVRNINIKGNNYLKDNYILNYLDIDSSSLLKISRTDIKNKLMKIDLINDVIVHKNILGSITIEINEGKVLFYNLNNKKIVLSNGKEIDYNSEYLGIPTLINYVKDNVYKDFTEKLDRVEKEILMSVSEIEYSPSEVNGKIVDEGRFLFRMNDGNLVYINTINIEKINNYFNIYEAVMNKGGLVKGCLYLDSNSENKHFGSCDEKKIVEEDVLNEGEN